MTLAILPENSGALLPNAPVVLLSGIYKELAKLPGLIHVIDPHYLDAKGNGVDVKSGGRVTPRNQTMNKINSDPNFNGHPTIDMPLPTGGLRLPTGSARRRMGFLSIARLDPARRAAGTTSNLFTTLPPEFGSAYGWSYRAGGQNITAYMDGSGSGAGGTAAGNDATNNTPLSGQTALWGCSYDPDTPQKTWAQMYRDDMVLANASSTLDDDDIPWATHHIEYGGYSDTLGWVGQVGIGLWFDRQIHKGVNRDIYTAAAALLNEYYAIVP